MPKTVKGARVRHKRTDLPNVTPTIPTNLDHTTGWLDTDIYEGELFINTNATTPGIWFREASGITQMATLDKVTGKIPLDKLPSSITDTILKDFTISETVSNTVATDAKYIVYSGTTNTFGVIGIQDIVLTNLETTSNVVFLSLNMYINGGTSITVNIKGSNGNTILTETSSGTTEKLVDLMWDNSHWVYNTTTIGGGGGIDPVIYAYLSNEVVTRDNADSSLSSSLSSEVVTRDNADSSLSTALVSTISSEVVTRVSYDSSLSASLVSTISSEVVTRTSVDNSLSTAITLGTGNVNKVGTPVDNQIGVWTGDGTIEGTNNLTWNGTIFSLGGNITFINGSNRTIKINDNNIVTPDQLNIYGQNNSDTTNGYNGGDVNVLGGRASTLLGGGFSSVGGVGGVINITGGDGGMNSNSSSPAVGGIGGHINIFGGVGGQYSNSNPFPGPGGVGGDVNITGGVGGTSSTILGTGVGGDGGKVYIYGGVGGTGSSNGSSGNVYIGRSAISTTIGHVYIGNHTTSGSVGNVYVPGGIWDLFGRVAIGTTSISSGDYLTVNGNVNITGNIQFASGSARELSIISATSVNTLSIKGQTRSGTGGLVGGDINIISGSGSNKSTVSAGNGGVLTIYGGTGGNGTTTATGGEGGKVTISGGVGGNSVSGGAGVGGDIHIKGGAAGSGSATGNSGHVYIYGGISGNKGNIYLGSDDGTNQYGTTYVGNNITFIGSVQRTISMADSDTVTILNINGQNRTGTLGEVGGDIVIKAGNGSTKSSNNQGDGGNTYIKGGVGASETTISSIGGIGGKTHILGGDGGTGIAGQGKGGDVHIYGGNGGSTANDGDVYIGFQGPGITNGSFGSTLYANLSNVATGNYVIFNTTTKELTYGAATSDIKFKKDLNKITNAISTINKISGYTFTYNDNASKIGYFDTTTINAGVIAQEVEIAFPDVVRTYDIPSSKIGETYKMVEYDQLIPLLIEGIKELKTIIDNQQIEIDILKNK